VAIGIGGYAKSLFALTANQAKTCLAWNQYPASVDQHSPVFNLADDLALPALLPQICCSHRQPEQIRIILVDKKCATVPRDVSVLLVNGNFILADALRHIIGVFQQTASLNELFALKFYCAGAEDAVDKRPEIS